ncbi:MAG: fimbria/pilus chaperone family protein [Arsenophonus sp. ET-DL9-MAG3]
MSIKNIFLLFLMFNPLISIANHLKLYTSAVIIEANIGENAFPVKNESTSPIMMLVTLEPLPEDPEKIVIITPPISRIEPYDTQVVRFLLKNTANLKTERMARVKFESIPAKGERVDNRININIAQNIPIIVKPKELKRNYTPWKHLQWKMINNILTVYNPSLYVIRFHPRLTLLPSKETVSLPSTYLLPGKNLSVNLPIRKRILTAVKLTPASLYNYMQKPVQLSVSTSSSGA